MWLNHNKIHGKPEDCSVRFEIRDKDNVANSVQNALYPHYSFLVALGQGLVCKGYGFNQLGLINYLNELIVI